MDVKYLMILLVGHFMADFGLQTNDQARFKGNSVRWLLYHTAVYSAAMMLLILSVLSIPKALIFGLITFGAHTLTDYCTSRIGKPFWESKDFHNGFVTVGFDQMLHYIQLYLTLNFLL